MDGVRVVHVAPGQMSEADRKRLADVVASVADEFVPPLSDRRSTTESRLTGQSGSDIGPYFNGMMEQHNLLLFEADQVCAFMSYRTGHAIPELPEVGRCTYVSTVAVHPDHRRHGYARLLYEQLLGHYESRAGWIVLRTWSTNESHIELLHTLGFHLLLKIDHHRGTGLDTLYFGRQRPDLA